jgi:hypothetical protein
MLAFDFAQALSGGSTMSHVATPTALIVAERGSAWNRWLERVEGGAEGAVVVLQERTESPDRFAQRVRTRVAELEASRSAPPQVVLVGGPRGGVLPSRSLMVRALSAALARRGGGQLWLDNHDSDRFTMRALADTVGGMMRGTGVDVSHAPHPPVYAQVA